MNDQALKFTEPMSNLLLLQFSLRQYVAQFTQDVAPRVLILYLLKSFRVNVASKRPKRLCDGIPNLLLLSYSYQQVCFFVSLCSPLLLNFHC